MNVVVVIKRSPKVLKPMIGIHHESLKVLELHHYRNHNVMRLVLRPHHIETPIVVTIELKTHDMGFSTRISQWMARFIRGTSES